MPTLTDPAGAHTLSAVLSRLLTLACAKCGRRGSYAVGRLIETHGDVTLIWLREHLSDDCPRRKAKSYTDWLRCKV